MTTYAIELNIEGNKILLDCKNKEEFEYWSEKFEIMFPEKDWKLRIEKQ